MRVVEIFFLQESGGPEPFFRRRVAIEWRAGTAFREFRHTGSSRLNRSGIRMTVFKKNASRIQAQRDFLSPQRLSSERCDSSTHKGNWTC